jgi:ribosomal protein S27E
MVQVSFAQYNEPIKMRCECCDRLTMVEMKMFVAKAKRLVGDLDLCAGCGEVLIEVTGQKKVEQEWSFEGGDVLG